MAKKIRIFLSSTLGTDAEKSVIIKRIIPFFNDLLCEHGIIVEEYDLGWGIDRQKSGVNDFTEPHIDSSEYMGFYYICILGGYYGNNKGPIISNTHKEIEHFLKLSELSYKSNIGADIPRVFCFFYERDDSEEDFYSGIEKDSEYYSHLSQNKLSKLKDIIRNRIDAKKYIKYSCKWNNANIGREPEVIYPVCCLDGFEEKVKLGIWEHIQKTFGIIYRTYDDDLDRVIQLQHNFIESQNNLFAGRGKYLSELSSAVDRALSGELTSDGKSTGYISIKGTQGIGKTALLSKFYSFYKERHPEYVFIPWFIEASPDTEDAYNILEYLCRFIIREYGLKSDKEDYKVPCTIYYREELLKDLLKKIDRPLIIVFDGASQLHPNSYNREMYWFPDELPADVCIISSIEEDAYFNLGRNTLTDAAKGHFNPYIIDIGKLSESDRDQIISKYLNRFNRMFPNEKLKTIHNKMDSLIPLYLHQILSEIRYIISHCSLEHFDLSKFPETIREMSEYILNKIFQELKDNNENQLLKIFNNFIIFLSCSDHGLDEYNFRLLLVEWRDLIHFIQIMPKDKNSKEYERWQKNWKEGIKSIRINDDIWRKLLNLLKGYIIKRGNVIDFLHYHLKEHIFGIIDNAKETKKEFHDNLKDLTEMLAIANNEKEYIVNGVKFKVRYIQPGSFIMGSDRRHDEKPAHKVIISKGFWMMETQVTQELYEEVMGDNPSHKYYGIGPNNPVNEVSWYDAVKFSEKLSDMTGENWELPTEAQWEYACRAGTEKAFHYGDKLDSSMANFDDHNEGTVPVKSFSPNAWGLYDMHGNVLEWCADWYGEYREEEVTDPVGPKQGSDRVFRGGSWINFAENSTVSYRYYFTPDGRDYDTGFRVALSQVKR